MNIEVALPVLLPLLSGALSLAFWRSLVLQRWLSIIGNAGLLVAAIWLLLGTLEHGVLVKHMGNWSAPYGITLVADMLSAIMVVLTGIIALAVAIFALPITPSRHERFGYYPLMHLLLAGVCGSFLTGDIFNLFVWFEVMLIASFALLTLGGERAQMEGAIKYVSLNLFSSAIFLSAVGLLYGMMGTLNMADLSVKIASMEDRSMVNVLAMLFLICFSIKAAAFPLFFWLPASYHTPLIAVSALFAGLLTKVGVYALYRVFTLLFYHDPEFTHQILLWIAVFTMVTGVLGAAAQFEFRRILSFHIISQIGYMILGLALFTPLAIIGGVFYLMHHMIVKTTLFLISGITYRLTGTYELKSLGGLYRDKPGLALLFLVPALSLAGLPPLSGFFAKFIVIKAGIEAEAYVVTAVALIVGLLTLYSMIKIWAEVFWKARPEAGQGNETTAALPVRHGVMLYVPVVALVACTLFIGLNGQPIYEMADISATQLLDRGAYIDAVLGGPR